MSNVNLEQAIGHEDADFPVSASFARGQTYLTICGDQVSWLKGLVDKIKELELDSGYVSKSETKES